MYDEAVVQRSWCFGQGREARATKQSQVFRFQLLIVNKPLNGTSQPSLPLLNLSAFFFLLHINLILPTSDFYTLS